MQRNWVSHTCLWECKMAQPTLKKNTMASLKQTKPATENMTQ